MVPGPERPGGRIITVSRIGTAVFTVTAVLAVVDRDLFGVLVPRHAPITPRPGLFHLVEDGTLRLVQVAVS